jgi:hypothetical protein
VHLVGFYYTKKIAYFDFTLSQTQRKITSRRLSPICEVIILLTREHVIGKVSNCGILYSEDH